MDFYNISNSLDSELSLDNLRLTDFEVIKTGFLVLNFSLSGVQSRKSSSGGICFRGDGFLKVGGCLVGGDCLDSGGCFNGEGWRIGFWGLITEFCFCKLEVRLDPGDVPLEAPEEATLAAELWTVVKGWEPWKNPRERKY